MANDSATTQNNQSDEQTKGNDNQKKFVLKYDSVAHIGNNVSHAKNRTKRTFKRNLHTVTIEIDGEKQKMKVPTKVLRQLKKQGVTTHWKGEE
jgi:large subunit ribosomal protein L28